MNSLTKVADMIYGNPDWVFDFLRAKLPLWAEMHTGGPKEAEECLKALKAIEDEMKWLKESLEIAINRY